MKAGFSKMKLMKKYVLLLMFITITVAGIAQTKPKPKQKEAVPTQKEMADMMKEMQKAMDEMSPEDKKMMDSMGIKMPDMKGIQKTVSGLSDELGVGGSVGPVKAEATIGSGIELEIDKSGVQDVSIVSKAKLEAGIEAPESEGEMPIDKKINKGVEQINKGISKMNTSVDIGVESRTSLISGCGSVTGTGILKDITLSQW
jgi:hypothetical protein